MMAAGRNPDNGMRTAQVIFEAEDAGGSPVTVTVLQAPNPPVLDAAPRAVFAPYEGGSYSLEVNNLGGGILPWAVDVSEGAEWIRFTSGQTGNNHAIIHFDISRSRVYESRDGLITVMSPLWGSLSIYINQEAAPDLRSDVLVRSFQASVPGGVWPAEIEAEIRIANAGSGPTEPTTVRFFLAEDPDDWDSYRLLATKVFGPIDPQSDILLHEQLHPGDEPIEGDYYLVARLDESEVLDEKDRGNNSAWCRVSYISSVAGALTRPELKVFPNPSTGANIRFEVMVPADTRARLEILTLDGRLVAVLHDGSLPGGVRLILPGPSTIPPGLFIYRLVGQGVLAHGRLVITTNQ
jgi:hypothetical protein